MNEAAACYDYDILIVGGGPAGMSTWLHLHALAPELASRTLLIERARYPRDKLCGGGITRLGDLLLGGLGVRIDCPSVSIDTVAFHIGAEELLRRQPGAFRVIRRAQFDHALASAAVERGLALHQEEAFIDFERNASGLTVRTNRREYRCQVLVGADGVHSAVRKKVAPDDEPRLARLIEVVTPVDGATDPLFATNTAVFDFSAVAEGLQGYVWHFPCVVDGSAAVNHGIYDSRVHPEAPRADLKTIFAKQVAAWGGDVHSPCWSGHPLRWFSEDTVIAQPHVFLVGDAAGVDSVFGEGIAPSLDYGDFAANLLIEAFGRTEFSFEDARARLAAHPLGISLHRRAALARAVYQGESAARERLPHLLAAWLPSN